MAKLKVIAVSLLVLWVGISFGIASAQTRLPGVSVGDSFKYTFDFDINVGDLGFGLPSLLEGLIAQVKSIDSVQMTVTQVSGSLVTMQTVMQFKNGTQQSSSISVDVASGADTANEGITDTFLIASNLNSGDAIYAGGNGGEINETVTRTYNSESRQLNHQSIVTNFNVTPEELQGTGLTYALQQSNTQDTYWDKQTGALVEMSFNMESTSQQINADISLNVRLVESNVITIPEFPVTILLVALAFAVAASAICIRYKCSK